MNKEHYTKGDYIKTSGYHIASGRVTRYGIIVDIKEDIVVKWDNTGTVNGRDTDEITLVPVTALFREWGRAIKAGRLLILQREFNLTPESAEEIYNANPALLPHNVKNKFYFFGI